MAKRTDRSSFLRWPALYFVTGIMAATATGHFQAAHADFAAGVAAYDAKDYASAFKEWLPLAKDGDPAAQRNVGHLYRRGLGVKKDLLKAVEWYRLAADQGFDRAQANLAYMYLNGDGVDRDFSQAAELFYLAAIQGHPIAQFNLGQMYQLGWGVPKDQSRAMAWYNLAAKAGHKKALDRLSVMILQSGPPRQEKDGGKKLASGVPEGEPGWEDETFQAAQAARKAETATEPPEKAASEQPTRIPDKPAKVAAVTVPSKDDEAENAATESEKEQTSADETPNPDDNKEEDGGFFSRFFSLKAPVEGQDNSGTREAVGGVSASPTEPLITEVRPTEQKPAEQKETELAEAADEPAASDKGTVQPDQTPSAVEQTDKDDTARKPASTQKETSVVAAVEDKPEAVAKPWVNPDGRPVNKAVPTRKPGDPKPEIQAREITVTVINPPIDEAAQAEPAPPAEDAKPKDEKGFFARFFGSGDEAEELREAASVESIPSRTPEQPASKPVVDLTALPDEEPAKSTKSTKLARKVKEVEVAALPSPPVSEDKQAANSQKPSAGPANKSLPQVAIRAPVLVEPAVPIPDPVTGPMEQSARTVIAQKTRVAGEPVQIADSNPNEFFAPKVTIDWNTVLKPSSSYTAPAKTADGRASAKTPTKTAKKKSGSLADSDQATLTELAAQQGLIDPLQMGLIAYRTKDFKTAIKHWLPMAHSGKSRAQFYMGGLYHDGTGVERDQVQAFVWWSLAADKGYNPALTARERLRDRMSEVEVAEAMSRIRDWRPIVE